MVNKNVEQFINGTVHYFLLIGFEFEEKHKWMKYLFIGGILNMGVVLLGQVMVVPFSDIELQIKVIGIAYMNYFFMSFGKIIVLIYNRKAILEILNEFRQIYPSEELEKAYELQKHLKQYKLIENFLVIFFNGISIIYNFYPLVASLAQLAGRGTSSYRVPLMMWYPIDISNHWWSYGLAYLQQILANYESAIIILGLDLCVFSSLLQLCMNFDVINKNILTIEPCASDEDEEKLLEIIAHHQRVLRLAEKVNDIFTPSVLFCLLSSAFIICFTGYQLLSEISTLTIIKSITLLGYEMKQTIITCFLADKLMEISLRTSDVIYEHKWYNGTLKYKRTVLIVLMRSQKAIALKIAGISDVSRQTLRAVMSISYQAFTVLKTS